MRRAFQNFVIRTHLRFGRRPALTAHGKRAAMHLERIAWLTATAQHALIDHTQGTRTAELRSCLVPVEMVAPRGHASADHSSLRTMSCWPSTSKWTNAGWGQGSHGRQPAAVESILSWSSVRGGGCRAWAARDYGVRGVSRCIVRLNDGMKTRTANLRNCASLRLAVAGV